MTPLKTFAFRLPAYLVDRIDNFAKMKAELDGRPCDRSTAVRMLLEKGLDMETPKAGSTALRLLLEKGLDMETPKAWPRPGLVIPKPPTAAKKKRAADRTPGDREDTGRITGTITDEFEPPAQHVSEESGGTWSGFGGTPLKKKAKKKKKPAKKKTR